MSMRTVREPRIYKFLREPDRDHSAKHVLTKNEVGVGIPGQRKFIVHNEYDRSYLVFDSYCHYEDWFSAQETNLHEVIHGKQRQKLKFDIDAKPDIIAKLPQASLVRFPNLLEYIPANTPTGRKQRYLLNTILLQIKRLFRWLYKIRVSECDFAIADSSDDTKFSAHIIVITYCVQDNTEAAQFTQRLLSVLPANVAEALDANVNKSVQNFRLPNNYKKDSTRVKRLVTRELPVNVKGRLVLFKKYDRDLIITETAGCILLPALVEQLEPEAQTGANNIVDDAVAQSVLNITGPIITDHEFLNRYGNLYVFRRLKSGHCKICNRIHDNDNTYFVTVNKGGDVRLHCRHSAQYCGGKTPVIILGSLGQSGEK